MVGCKHGFDLSMMELIKEPETGRIEVRRVSGKSEKYIIGIPEIAIEKHSLMSAGGKINVYLGASAKSIALKAEDNGMNKIEYNMRTSKNGKESKSYFFDNAVLILRMKEEHITLPCEFDIMWYEDIGAWAGKLVAYKAPLDEGR